MDFVVATSDVYKELVRAEIQHPNYPVDPVRRAAILAEEAGEAIAAALDLTRVGTPKTNLEELDLRSHLYEEAVQAAAMAIRLIVAMQREKESTDAQRARVTSDQ
jgi:hypothetical protein